MWMAPRSQATEAIRMRGYRAYQYVFMILMNIYFTEILTLYIISDSQSIQTYIHHTPLCTLHIHNLLVTILYTLSQMSVNFWCLFAGLGSIPFFQFNSNSVISNSNSTTHKKFQFQFQFRRFQFQFQFRRFQIQPQFQKWPFEVFCEIHYNHNNKVAVYKIIVIDAISLIALVKWL